MAADKAKSRHAETATGKTPQRHDLPGQVVLALQGGGALGAFQAGVYEAMHEAGIEPDWVIGTSIGAINGAIIAGNAPGDRLSRLREFWDLVAGGAAPYARLNPFGLGNLFANLGTVSRGIPGFFAPNLRSWFGTHSPLGVADAGFYTTAPLRETLKRLADLGRLAVDRTRLTLGAVNARSGRMRYFDSREDILSLEHVMASGALPPAFPAVIIDGEPYWDGGIYSNTPIEVVMDDAKRRDSVIFAAQLWQQYEEHLDTIQQVMNRLKDIQYASRAENHIARQQQLHQLRHVVRELGRLLPDELKATTEVTNLLGYGCGTIMHIVPLRASRIEGEDHSKDIDFTPAGIRARWDAGRELARRKIEAAPWEASFDPVMGVVLHE